MDYFNYPAILILNKMFFVSKYFIINKRYVIIKLLLIRKNINDKIAISEK